MTEEEGVRVGRYSSLVRLRGAKVKIVRARAAGGDAMRRNVAYRELLDTPTPQRLLPKPTFPRILYYGSRDTDQGQEWITVQEFVPGQDLTSLVTEPGSRELTAKDVTDIGQAVGEELGKLHCASAPLVSSDSGELSDTWSGAIVERSRALIRTVISADTISGLDSDAVREARRVATKLAARRVGYLPIPGRWRACLVHGDAHGGNIVIDVIAGTSSPSIALIDEQLDVGDGIFDLCSLQNWAVEVLPDHLVQPFLGGLRSGYWSALPADGTPFGAFLHYHVLRSMGRLAYYARSDPRWIEPFGPGRLLRQIQLLDELAEHGIAWDTRIDPTAFPLLTATSAHPHDTPSANRAHHSPHGGNQWPAP